MYSESELAGAVKAGILPQTTLDALRNHIAAQRGEANTADDEQVRLITGFNDIFVTIACALVIFAAAMIGARQGSWLAGLLVAAASWPMAEMFTRRRRMALPSIVLLLAFVIGLGFFAGGLVRSNMTEHDVWHTFDPPYALDDGTLSKGWTTSELYPWQIALTYGVAAVAAGLGALVHWRRFRVAITIAAAVGSLVLLLLAALAMATNSELAPGSLLAPAALVCGLAVFAFAMRWDMADPARISQKADIAFWLHLLAAPLIAHPLFYWMGVTQGDEVGAGKASGVLAIYLLFALVALAVDRRALLVSALAYVLGTMSLLLRTHDNVELSLAVAALVIGGALLALSALWGPMRNVVVTRLPGQITGRLPPIAP